MAGVPGTASEIFETVKNVGANVVMISQVFDFSLDSLPVSYNKVLYMLHYFQFLIDISELSLILGLCTMNAGQ
jgi:hypothetical protein